jgi:glutathione synthase/RimK-type ligase-like ATP-grasp enzyme
VNQVLRNTIIQAVARRAPVINPPIPQNLHRQKPLLFSRLVRAGVPVPPFLCTSEPASAHAFAEHGWRSWSGVVDKPSAGIYKTTLWGDGSAKIHRWQTRPALLQRYIAGDTVRCYVLRDRVVAAARIVHGGTIDSSMSQTGIVPVELTSEQRSVAERTARALDLAFCGMDLMVEAAGNQTWLIDCNLSPMFVNFAKLSLVDVPGLLADALIEMAGEKVGDRPAVLDMVEEAKRLLASDARLRNRRSGRGPGRGDEP